MTEVTPNPAEVVVTTTEPTGTEQKETVTTEHPDGVDYRQKFIDSSKGAMALLEENKKLKAELEAKTYSSSTPADGKIDGLTTHSSPELNVLYPGFDELSPEAQQSIIALSNAIEKRVASKIESNPALSYAGNMYNDTKWEAAFAEVSAKLPELVNSKTDFKAQYYNPQNVPDNISEILESLAKAYLFDKAREIGRKEGAEVAERVQLEEPTAGDKTPMVHRSLSDWQRMAQTNPTKFASLRKEFEADIASGKLKE